MAHGRGADPASDGPPRDPDVGPAVDPTGRTARCLGTDGPSAPVDALLASGAGSRGSGGQRLGVRGEQAERLVEERIRAALPDGVRCLRERPLRRADAPRRPGARRRGGPRRRPPGARPPRHRDQVRRAAPRRAAGWFIGEHQLEPQPVRAGRGRQARPRRRDRRRPRRSRPTAGRAPATPSPSRTRTSRACRAATSSWARTPTREIILDAAALATPRSHAPGPRAGLGLVDRRRLARPPADARAARRASTSSSPPRSPSTASSTATSTTAGSASSRPRTPSGSSSTSIAPSAASRSSGPPGAARAWSPSRRPAASPARAGGPCSCASTSRSRRPSGARSTRTASPPTAARRSPPSTACARRWARRPARCRRSPPTPLPRELVGRHAAGARWTTPSTRLPDERFHAIVVDEGQDFELAWLESLELPAVRPRRRRPVGLPRPGPGALPRRPRRRSWASTASSCSRTTARRRPSRSSPRASTAAPLEPYAVTEAGRDAGRRRRRARARHRRGRPPAAPPADRGGGRPRLAHRGALGRVREQERRLEAAHVRQRGAVERGDRRRRELARAPARTQVPGRAARCRRRPVRDRPPVQGPGAAGRRSCASCPTRASASTSCSTPASPARRRTSS